LSKKQHFYSSVKAATLHPKQPQNTLLRMKTVLFLGLLLLLLATRQTTPAQSLTVNTASHYAPASATIANPDGEELWSATTALLKTDHLRVSRYPSAIPSVLKLLFQNQTGSPLQLTILNDKYEPIYETSKDRRRTWGWLLFDLSALPAGQYTLHIKAAREHTERPFTLGVPRPVVFSTEPEIFF
jgi:hypothetical protein